MAKLDKRARVRRIAEGILDLPTLPTVVAKIVELVDNPRTNASTLARLISTDPALTARMLKLANSAYYGFPRRIGTINLAIVVLGFNTVRDLAVSASLVERISFSRDGGMMSDFWEHSIGTAIAARMVLRQIHHRSVGEAFVAGLLHDIGRLVVARYLPGESRAVEERLEESDHPLWVIEHEVLGMSHSEVGGLLCRRWNIPDSICEAITWHHHPLERGEADQLTCIVNFSEHLAHRGSANPLQEGPLGEMDDRVCTALELRRDEEGLLDMTWYAERFAEELTRAETFRDLVLGRDSEAAGHES